MLHGSIRSSITEFFREATMRMTTTTINQPAKRPALGSCFAHGTDRLAAKVWSFPGRTTE
jgi:hypothetical protein